MKIAIKGYIGSGKTTISNIIKNEFDFFIINADDIVEKLYQNDEVLKEEIVKKMNLSKFDKKELSNVVFSNEEKLKELEEIVHPILKSKIMSFIKKYENVIIDCQVIDKLNIDVDGEIIVYATKEEIIKRVGNRDNRSLEEINNILKLQEKFDITKNRTYIIDSQKEDFEILEDLKKILKLFENHIRSKGDNSYEENR